MNRLKELRIKRGLLQSDIAEIIKKSERTVGFYENGERDMGTETLGILADFFNVSVDYLLGRTNETNNIQKNDLHMAASSDIDLAKLAEMDPQKKKAITDNINAMISMFYEEFGKKGN